MMLSSQITILLSLACFLLTPLTGNAFAVRRSDMTMKRGRGSFQQQVPSSNQGGSLPSNKNWVLVSGLEGSADLPTEEGKVVLVDTNAPALTNSATNPTGAVGVVKYGTTTFCVSCSCASCQIPMTKARVMEPNEETSAKDPRIACDFCSATYNLRTGERLRSVQREGLLGGVMKNLFDKQPAKSLPVYELGEAKGRVVINIG